jgi:hypothetical protein
MTPSIIDYVGKFMPREVSDNLHDVNDVIALMSSQGWQAADCSTSTSTCAATSCGLTVSVNGYVYRKSLAA